MLQRKQSLPTETPSLRVGIILAENFTLSAFSLFIDHLRLAADKEDKSRPILCSWQIMNSRPESIRASCGISVSRTSDLINPSEFDYIAVVGGLLHGRRQVDETTIRYLQKAAGLGIPLIGICTGAFVLARAGIMNGRTSCVSWYHRQDFLEEFPDQQVASEQMYLVDGDRITCSGGGGTAELALHLIEKHLSRPLARKASHILLLDRPRRGDTPSLQPHPPISEDIGHVVDQRVRRAMMEMEQNMIDPLPISSVAKRLGISSRQLERLFQSVLGIRPAVFYRMIRLRYARSLLSQGEMSITQVAIETGFSDCAHFSRQFKTMFGHSPSSVKGRSEETPLSLAPLLAGLKSRERAGVRLFEST
ncbi:GlxA family transcriptional regulator [Acetobacter sp.]|jgi:transcriptional regulator GlxA family with amidase domain|uniref:GlxA family transcriptional regulator n=1 Tax=Acetobacter sp. TaxID=440 RepID=UPI0025BBCDC3|nr:GlxA family transcriptional regulator [Acetobacter sp.]MCH4090982.1 GlxA family transcriptional regulator [Acetobacter sp.]MCI1300165.1 GlxA family transcriptional regulator [Acetobacter sp.]MCI1316167.1 GlxA family transcriptional regulator [Acetobacter sp.]